MRSIKILAVLTFGLFAIATYNAGAKEKIPKAKISCDHQLHADMIIAGFDSCNLEVVKPVPGMFAEVKQSDSVRVRLTVLFLPKNRRWYFMPMIAKHNMPAADVGWIRQKTV